MTKSTLVTNHMYVRDEKYVSDENGMLVTKKSVGDERYVSDENEYVGD